MINTQEYLLNNIKNIKYDSVVSTNLNLWSESLHKQNQLTCLQLNIRSLRKYWDVLMFKLRHVIDKIDVLALNEIKMTEEEAEVYNIQGFLKLVKCRQRGKGGGIAVFYRDTFIAEQLFYDFDESENINFKLILPERKAEYLFLAIYRPPNRNAKDFFIDLDWWLKHVTKKNDSIVLLGDINIDLVERSSERNQYMNTLYGNEMVPTITDHYTREEYMDGELKTSCIDHINLKLKFKYSVCSHVIQEKLADHYFVSLQLYTKGKENKTRKDNEIRTVKIYNLIDINKEISETNWNEMLMVEDSQELYRTIVAKFEEIYTKCCTLKRVNTKHDLAPWVDSELIALSREKHDLLDKWRQDKTNLLFYEEYRVKRNIVTNLAKKKRRIYIFKLLREANGDIKKVWEVLNFLLERNIKCPCEQKLRNNFQIENLKELANNFNKNFINQIKELKSSNDGPTLNVDMTPFISQKDFTSLNLRPPSIKEIDKIITDLRTTGPGIDGIRPVDIKNNKMTLLTVVTYLIRVIITTGVIPGMLKVSCATPVFKKGKVNELGNYRPIGSLCCFEKILEKYLKLRMSEYLTLHNIIPNFQHGFQNNKSTLTLLEDFSELSNKALDTRKYIVIIWLDLTKAFDTIQHSKLLRKFEDLGISHRLFTNYFQDRKQRVKLGSVLSDEEMVDEGLVQGGVCSPVWYNVYTYDVQFLKLSGHLRMFADDSCLVSIHTSLRSAIEVAQTDFINLQKYFYNNNIYINELKTEAMIMGRASEIKEKDKYKILCHSRVCLYLETYKSTCLCPSLKFSKTCKYLGVNIDEDFKMKQHIFTLCKKLRIINYKLRKNNVHLLPIKTKKIIYYSLVESLIRYGVTLYTCAPRSVLQSVFNNQDKILCYLFQSHSSIRSFLNPEHLSILINVINHYDNNQYRKIKPTSYSLRRQEFQSSFAYTKNGERLLSYVIPKLLNKYGKYILHLQNKSSIKKELKVALLNDQLS